MKKYKVPISWTVSGYIIVDAENELDATNVAERKMGELRDISKFPTISQPITSFSTDGDGQEMPVICSWFGTEYELISNTEDEEEIMCIVNKYFSDDCSIVRMEGKGHPKSKLALYAILNSVGNEIQNFVVFKGSVTWSFGKVN